jgi:hypothetical protein
MKVVYNGIHGGYELSDEALDLYIARVGNPVESDDDISRNDPILIGVIEELGAAANGKCACLNIFEVPDGVDCEIHAYDGLEEVVVLRKGSRRTASPMGNHVLGRGKLWESSRRKQTS